MLGAVDWVFGKISSVTALHEIIKIYYKCIFWEWTTKLTHKQAGK